MKKWAMPNADAVIMMWLREENAREERTGVFRGSLLLKRGGPAGDLIDITPLRASIGPGSIRPSILSRMLR
jgi:hypothetical protein